MVLNPCVLESQIRRHPARRFLRGMCHLLEKRLRLVQMSGENRPALLAMEEAAEVVSILRAGLDVPLSPELSETKVRA